MVIRKEFEEMIENLELYIDDLDVKGMGELVKFFILKLI